jgi:hypothetical protein
MLKKRKGAALCYDCKTQYRVIFLAKVTLQAWINDGNSADEAINLW